MKTTLQHDDQAADIFRGGSDWTTLGGPIQYVLAALPSDRRMHWAAGFLTALFLFLKTKIEPDELKRLVKMQLKYL